MSLEVAFGALLLGVFVGVTMAVYIDVEGVAMAPPADTYDRATAWSKFHTAEVQRQLECCETPDPCVEESDIVCPVMNYSGVCRSCGEGFDGKVYIRVEVLE